MLGSTGSRGHSHWPERPEAPPQQYQAPAAPGQPDDMTERLGNLTKLGELMNAGLLTQAEFDQQKARILSG